MKNLYHIRFSFSIFQKQNFKILNTNTLIKQNTTLFLEYKLHMPTEQELISAVEEEKKNFELNDEI